MHHLERWIAPAALGLVIGCAGYSPTVPKDERPGENDAYLYGRFQINTAQLMHIWGQTMGFVYKCEDTKQYTLRFEKEEPLQVVKISPSTCTMAEIVYTNSNGTIRKPVPDGGRKFAHFAAGKAYYLGDFYAEAKSTSQGGMTHSEWHITKVVDDYALTTEKLKTAYPSLRSLPTEDRLRQR